MTSPRLAGRCGRHSSASEGAHFLGGIRAISPEIPNNSQIRIFRGQIGGQAHLFNQVSSLITFIYYYITPGRVKRGVQQVVNENRIFLAHTPIIFTRSQRWNLLIYISEQQKSFGSIRADLRKWFSNRNAPTRASPASAEPRWSSPSLAGKIRHPTYPPLFMLKKGGMC